MFGLKDVEIKEDYDLIPEGRYQALIEGAEWKSSKAGSDYLNIKFKIVAPEQKGRYVWTILNLFHHNEKVLNIAKANLKRLLIACGHSEEIEPKDKNEVIELILNKIVEGKVIIVKGKGDYKDKNDFRYYSKPEKELAVDFDGTDIPF